MTKLILTVFTALSLVEACFALAPQVLEERGYDKTSAYTRMGDKYNAHVRTYHSDVYTPCTKTKTVQTTKTEIVNPKSKFTTTITTTKTVTADTASTSTVASSAGFVPIRSSLPDPGPPAAAAGVQLKRSPAPGLTKRIVNVMEKGKYPQRVDVYHYKEKKQCVIKTKTVTQTKKACKTPVKSTVTSTATSKVTVYPSTTTVYAACQTDNMITSYRGATIKEFGVTDQRDPADGPNGGLALVSSNVTDATACCISAILMSPPSVLWTFNSVVSSDANGNCNILTDTTCRAAPRLNGPNFEATVYSDARETTSTMTAGNSYCGQFDRGCYTDADGVRTCMPEGDTSQDPPVDDPEARV